jgi:hypothetical protein
MENLTRFSCKISWVIENVAEFPDFGGILDVPSSQAGRRVYTRLPACEDGTQCSETSAYKLQTPGNYPKEGIHISNTAKI